MSVKYLLVCFLIVKFPNSLNPPNINMLSISELLLILEIYCIIICKNLIALLFLLTKVYTQNCQMDILIRYFDHVENRVKVRYLDSTFFGHAALQDLFIQFTQALLKLDTNKMLQVSTDGPFANLKFFEKLQKDHLENEQHELINIGGCGLHTIHGAFKTGAESTSWNIRKRLHGSYQILHDSPAPRDDFETITASNIYSFNFCATWSFTFLFLSFELILNITQYHAN